MVVFIYLLFWGYLTNKRVLFALKIVLFWYIICIMRKQTIAESYACVLYF